VGAVIAGGFNPRQEDLQLIYTNKDTLGHATDWLTERGDVREQREQRLETVEWGILIFAVLAILVALGWTPWRLVGC
jgi:hypothetical protein